MNDEMLRDALQDAPTLAVDADFAEQLENRLRNAVAAAPIAEMEQSAPRRTGRRTAAVAIAVAAVLMLVLAIVLSGTDRSSTPTVPIDSLRYRAHGNAYEHGKNVATTTDIIDGVSGATLSFDQRHDAKDSLQTETLYFGGHAYGPVDEWVRDHGWPDASRLHVLRGKDWIDRGANDGSAFTNLPLAWRRDRFASNGGVRRVGPATLGKERTTLYVTNDSATSDAGPFQLWVDAAGNLVQVALGPPNSPSIVYQYAFHEDDGSVARVDAPDPRAVIARTVLDDPSLCDGDIPSDLVTSCRVHPGIATTGYRFTRTSRQIADDQGFRPVTTSVAGAVDAERMAFSVEMIDADTGRRDTGTYIGGIRRGTAVTSAQRTFSLDALVDNAPFVGTFDVLGGLRRAHLDPRFIGRETVRGVATKHYRARQALRFTDSTGSAGTKRTFDVWVDGKGRIAHLVIATQIPGNESNNVHPQHQTDTLDFFDYDTRPTISAPSR